MLEEKTQKYNSVLLEASFMMIDILEFSKSKTYILKPTIGGGLVNVFKTFINHRPKL